MIQVVDFFCGCGGTSAGLQAAGLEIVAGIDFDETSGRTYKKNFPRAEFLLEDIRFLQPCQLERLISKTRARPLMFSACAPCQPFSKQKTTKRQKDVRATLLDELHRFIRVFRPDLIFLENVPGLQKFSSEGGAFGRFVQLLTELEYKFSKKLVRSQDYGVPQYRQRLVLIASLFGAIDVPSPTHGPGASNEEYRTVWDAISDLPPIGAGERHPEVPNHQSAALSEINLRRIRATPTEGGRTDWPTELMLKCHSGHSGHSDVYGRMSKNRPAGALTTRCISLSNGRYGHPTQDRAISVREAARLQTFDDNFVFEGSMTSAAKQIGNAVPVQLAKTFGIHFGAHCSGMLVGAKGP